MTVSTSSATPEIRTIVSKSRFAGLWWLLKGHYLAFGAANLALAISSFSRTATYLLIGYFVDDVLKQNKPWQTLAVIASGFLGLALLQGGFTFLSGWLATRTAEDIALRLRNYIYDHIQRLSFSYHDQTRTGELIQRATSDVEAVRQFFQDQAMSMGRIFLLFVINFVAIWRISSRLALLSVIIVPLLVILSFFFFRRISQRYERYQEQAAVLSSTLQENLYGVRVVKAFARQQYEIDKFQAINWEKYRRGRRVMLMHALFWPGSDFIAGFQMLLGYVVAGWMVMDGRISIGNYVSYVGMLIFLIWPMRNLGRVIVQTSTALVSYGRVATIIRAEQEPLGQGDYHPAGPVAGDIQFEDVCFSYDGQPENASLRQVSFRCAAGQTVALLGASGSGKTTLVNLLPRFYDYIAGRILLDGVALTRYTRKFLRSQIAFVEQEPFLFSRTLRENIAYGLNREVSDVEIVAATRAAAIHESILNFPQGYDTLVGERGVTLSGGQKQRIAIARAILRNPRILILDDATSSVDAETEESIQQALQGLMAGRTTFVIAHRFQTVMNADLIIVLEDGEIAQMGDHATLVQQEGFYRDIYTLQSRLDALG